LHSILDVSEDFARPLRLHHDSFRDFLSDKTRCQDSRLFVNKKEAHARLVTRCIKAMSSALKEDVCGERMPGVRVSDVSISHIQRCLPSEVQYACLYWARHLISSGERLLDDGDVHQFLREHALHWMEAMSWMGKTSEAIEAMTTLESITEVKPPVGDCDTVKSRKLTHDTGRRMQDQSRSGPGVQTISDVRKIWYRTGTAAGLRFGCAVCTFENCPARGWRKDNTRQLRQAIPSNTGALECSVANAGRPLELGLRCAVLAGRQQAGVGIRRQESDGVEPEHRRTAAHAGRPLELGHCCAVLAGRQQAGVGIT
jgi:hypothetical protein